MKKGSSVSGRAWRLLRLALLWARKGSAFKRSLMLDMRMAFKAIRTGGGGETGNRIHYMEREFSFDETPLFNVKMHRPASMRMPKIPCITPSVDFDEDDDWTYERQRDLFQSERMEEVTEKIECVDNNEAECEADEGIQEEEEEKEIDTKAEEFIAEFYKQMKLQRQISWLQYNEMLCGGMS